MSVIVLPGRAGPGRAEPGECQYCARWRRRRAAVHLCSCAPGCPWSVSLGRELQSHRQGIFIQSHSIANKHLSHRSRVKRVENVWEFYASFRAIIIIVRNLAVICILLPENNFFFSETSNIFQIYTDTSLQCLHLTQIYFTNKIYRKYQMGIMWSLR